MAESNSGAGSISGEFTTEMPVSIGGQKFKAIKIVDLSHKAVVPEHKVEDGYNVADHIIHKVTALQLTLELLKTEGEVSKILQIYKDKKPVNVTTEFGKYPDMVLDDLKIRDSDSMNIAYATAHFKQIRKAKARITTVPIPEIAPPPAEDSTAESPETRKAFVHVSQNWDQMSDEEKKSLLDMFFGFIASWLGWDTGEKKNESASGEG